MEQRALGKTGIQVSAVGFGAGASGGLFVKGTLHEQLRTTARALEAGITFFDTAPDYGQGLSETNLGRTLRELAAWSNVTVGTKVRLKPEDLHEPEVAIIRSLKNSLKRLNCDRVDLLQLHNPLIAGNDVGGFDTDSEYPLVYKSVIEGIADGMSDVVRQGLARHIGMTGLGDVEALRAAITRSDFETIQTYFNLLNPSAGFAGKSGGGYDFAGIIDTATAAGMGVIAIRIMAAGALSAKPQRHPTAGGPGIPLARGAEYSSDVERASAFAAHAAKLGLDGPLELALRFALTREGISTVLIGFSDLGQLEDAIRWTDHGHLEQDVVVQIADMARTRNS